MSQQETPTSSEGSPLGGNSQSVPAIIFLVLCILGGGGFLWYQFANLEEPAALEGAGPGMGMTGATPGEGGLLGSFGDGEAVLVYGAYPGGTACHEAVKNMLQAIAEEHPDVIHVEVYPMGTPAVVEKTGSSCAGWAIYTNDGETETKIAYFDKSPDMGGWTELELKEAVEAAIAESLTEGGGDGEGASGESEPSDEESADDEPAEGEQSADTPAEDAPSDDARIDT